MTAYYYMTVVQRASRTKYFGCVANTLQAYSPKVMLYFTLLPENPHKDANNYHHPV